MCQVRDRSTAEESLERILYLLPAACGSDGVALDELAQTLNVDAKTVLADLEAITDRIWYHPPGGSDDLQITLTHDRVQVWTSGAFRRPARLNQREALCVAMGLRLIAIEEVNGGASADDEATNGASGGGKVDRRRPGGEATTGTAAPAPSAKTAGGAESRADATADLRRRLEKHLAVASTEGDEGLIRAPELDTAPEHARSVLIESARTLRPCRIRYVKPGSAKPEVRTVHPYVIVYAQGEWYVLGHAPEASAVRAFRLDRVLDAELQDGGFEVPADFDAADYITNGRMYRADSDTEEVVVRYAPRIARWIEEQGTVERAEDGSVLVRHRVSNPRWLVGHVLQYGADAEVVEPQEVRQMVREAAVRIGGRAGVVT